jgi:hypothetical protein
MLLGSHPQHKGNYRQEAMNFYLWLFGGPDSVQKIREKEEIYQLIIVTF